MAADPKGSSAAADDAIPMQKTGATTYVAAGVAVLALGGILAVTMGGEDKETVKKAEELKAKVEKESAAPKMSRKEQQEFLKMTARAMEKADAVEAQQKATAAQAKAQAEAQAREEEERKAAAAAGPAAPAAAPQVSKKQAKKQIDSLDSLGSDIANSLK